MDKSYFNTFTEKKNILVIVFHVSEEIVFKRSHETTHDQDIVFVLLLKDLQTAQFYIGTELWVLDFRRKAQNLVLHRSKSIMKFRKTGFFYKIKRSKYRQHCPFNSNLPNEYGDKTGEK